jgi:hypothetical protein
MGVCKEFAKEYYAWSDMRRRCYNKNRPQYPHYGGRGITVCDRWRNSFADFIADMGRAPDKSALLDRIDNDGNYEPGNVKWSTPKDSTNNRRRTRYAIVNGERLPVEVAAEVLGVTGAAIRDRLRRGESEERAGRPAEKRRIKYTIDGRTMLSTQWARHYNQPPATVNTRLRRGHTIEEALNLTPLCGAHKNGETT